MDPLTPSLLRLLDSERVGVLATAAETGRPPQSVVYFARAGDKLLISTLAGRLKARDVARDGWASLNVHGHEPPYPSATFSGSARVVTEQIGVPTARVMQRIAGMDEMPPSQPDEALAEADLEESVSA